MAGPAAALAVAEPQPLRTGLRAVLPLLRVHAADAHGNPATCPNCEVPTRLHGADSAAQCRVLPDRETPSQTSP